MYNVIAIFQPDDVGMQRINGHHDDSDDSKIITATSKGMASETPQGQGVPTQDARLGGPILEWVKVTAQTRQVQRSDCSSKVKLILECVKLSHCINMTK